MLEIDPKSRFAVSEDIVVKVLPKTGQYYAFDVKNGDHFSLNLTAHWTLERINCNVDFGSLLTDFVKEYGVSREDALKDLNELIEFALENNIIIRRRQNEEEESV